MTAARPRLAAVVLSLTAIATSLACAGGEGAGDPDLTPWVTAADSSGDTIRVRITGEIPASLVRSLVPELVVGAEDGSEEESFGSVSAVFGSDAKGLYVYDDQATALRLFDSTGAFVRNVGGKGGGPGEFEQVNGITSLPDGSIALWDGTGARINRYAPDGEFITSWRMPFGGWFTNQSMWSDAASRLYTWFPIERNPDGTSRSGLLAMDTTGAILDTLEYLQWRAPAPNLVARSPDGGMMTSTSAPFQPGNWTRLSRDGGLVSGPGDPYVLYLLPRDGGKPVRIEREHTPVPVSATERDERRRQITENMVRVNPAWTWTGPDIPSTKPAYRGLQVGRDGRIWVALSTLAEPIPQAELPVPRAGQPPRTQLTTREPSVYDVFSPAGRLLGRVALPSRTRIMTMGGAHVWGVRRDSLDVEYAVRFRIEPAFAP